MREAAAARRFSPAYLVWAIFFVAVGFMFLAPTRLAIAILLPEVMRGIGVTSLGIGGLISTLTLVGVGVTEPFAGRLSDLLGRGVALALGIGLFSLFTLLTAAAASLPQMISFRVLLGIGQGIFTPAYFAFVGGAFGKRRGFVLGSLAGLFTVGAAINPLTTRFAFNAAGKVWQAPFVAYGVFGLLLALVVAWFGRSKVYEIGHVRRHEVITPSPATGDGQTGLFGRGMVLLLITMIFWGLTQYGYLGLFVTFLRQHQHFSLREAVRVASVGGWTAFLFSFFGGWLSDHIGRRNALMLFGSISAVLSYPLFTLTHTFASALVLAAVFQASNGMFFPLGVAYAQDMAGAHSLGGHSGAIAGTGHLVAGFSGLVAGTIAGRAGFGALGWAFTLFSIMMILCIYFTADSVHETRLKAKQAVAV